MSQPDSTTAPVASSEATQAPWSTPLSVALSLQAAPHSAQEEPLVLHGGAFTPRVFEGISAEIDALLHSAGVSDLGWRGKIRVTGSDRLRWLSGMVSNTVQALPEGQGNYSFLLNVQGRIQGDCYVYRRPDDLLLDTSCDQIPVLMRHLDHYIIMDDVELADVSTQWTGLALTGPKSRGMLQTLGFVAPESASETARMHACRIGEVECVVVEAYGVTVPRFELWFAPQSVLAVWETLQAAGAVPCGNEALEALRVLDGVPLYGVDLNDRDLPQETAQTRALNFSKGCYLGQEIVERIRSRGKVNRQFRQFALEGDAPPVLPTDLRSGEQVVGRITSFASLSTAGLPHRLALGFVRVEVMDRKEIITYGGGVASALTTPPQIAGLVASTR